MNVLNISSSILSNHVFVCSLCRYMNTIFCNWRNVPLLPFHLSIFLKEIWICIRHVAQYRQYELLIIHFAYYKECIKKYLCFSRHTAPVVLMEMIYFCQYQYNILYSINEMKHYPNVDNSVYNVGRILQNCLLHWQGMIL